MSRKFYPVAMFNGIARPELRWWRTATPTPTEPEPNGPPPGSRHEAQAAAEDEPAGIGRPLAGGSFAGFGTLGAAAVGALALGLPGSHSRDRWSGRDLHELGADRGGLVAAMDGVPLAVRETGPIDAPLTVVFCHGYCLTMDTWHFQSHDLRRRFGDSIRMVFFDQRGHGQSGATSREHATIEQLADDLHSIIESTAPTGPLVLIGHSMGGMALMAFASHYPHTMRKRVLGVGLVATAAGKLSNSGLGAVLESRSLGAVADLAGRIPGVFTNGRRALALIIRPFIAGGSFGDPRAVSPTVAALVDRLIGSTSVETIAHFFDALTRHDQTASMPVLAERRTTILCGDKDLLTPLDRSAEIAEALPEAEFVIVPGAGHMVMLEEIDLVSTVLGDLVADALVIGGIPWVKE